MRHKVKSSKLNRNKAQLKSLVRNLVDSLVKHESMKTTKPKAKLASRVVDRLITRAKKNDKMTAIRYIAKYVHTKEASVKLIDDLAGRYQDRSSGFTRIIKLGARKGDNAQMVQIQFV